MPIAREQLGVRTPDGRTRAPTKSILSNRALAPGDVTIQLSKDYFVGVTAEEYRHLSAGEKAAMKDRWKSQVPDEAPRDDIVEGAVMSRGEALYNSLSLADLKRQASERKIDVTGRRSKADLINSLLAADIEERFATGATAGGGVEGAAEAVPGSIAQPSPQGGEG